MVAEASGAQAVLATSAVAVVVIAGAVWLVDPFGWRLAPEPETVIAQPVEPQPQTDSAEPKEVAAVPAAQDPAPKPEGPRLQEVRVESDGLAVIAGRAQPGADVIIRANGQDVARATADSTGAFATVAVLGTSSAARLLSLVELDDAGKETLSPDEIILAPVAVAAVEADDTAPVETATGEAEEAEQVATEIADAGSQTADKVMGEATETTQALNSQDTAETEAPVKAEDVAVANDAPQQDPVPEVKDDSVQTTVVSNTDDLSETAPTVTLSTSGATETAVATTASEPAVDKPVSVSTSAGATPASDAPAEDTAAVLPQSDKTPEPLAETEEVVAALDVADEVTDAVAAIAIPAPKPQPLADVAAVPETTETEKPTIAATQDVQRPEPAPEDLNSPKAEDTQQIALIKSNEDGVQVIQPVVPTPAELRRIALDSISYSVEGEVELAGRAQTGTDEIRIYLNNQPITQLAVDKDGSWRGELPDVDTGIYTLRIDEVRTDGGVSSRVETPFKRESAEVLQVATAQAAAGPVKAITVQKGSTLWAIARDRYGEGIRYVQVFEANRKLIRDPDLIYPGQVFTLPEN